MQMQKKCVSVKMHKDFLGKHGTLRRLHTENMQSVQKLINYFIIMVNYLIALGNTARWRTIAKRDDMPAAKPRILVSTGSPKPVR